jgi:hypothetical protein
LNPGSITGLVVSPPDVGKLVLGLYWSVFGCYNRLLEAGRGRKTRGSQEWGTGFCSALVRTSWQTAPQGYEYL